MAKRLTWRTRQISPSFVDLTLGLFLGDAVSLLNTTGQLLAIAFGPVEIVIGEVASLLPRLAL